MKRYFRNLFLAIFGNDPFQKELDDLSEKYEKAADHVKSLQDLYYKINEKMEEDAKMLISNQTLIENLRQRVTEKEEELEHQGSDYRERMDRMKAEYQQRIKEYNITIDELKKELADKSRQLEKLQVTSRKMKKGRNHGRRTGNQDASAEE